MRHRRKWACCEGQCRMQGGSFRACPEAEPLPMAEAGAGETAAARGASAVRVGVLRAAQAKAGGRGDGSGLVPRRNPCRWRRP